VEPASFLVCRALRAEDLSELAAALEGVTEAELFLAGADVRRGGSRDVLAEFALQQGVAVVLPSGTGLDTVVRPGTTKF
jgi:hypothetical protein